MNANVYWKKSKISYKIHQIDKDKDKENREKFTNKTIKIIIRNEKNYYE